MYLRVGRDSGVSVVPEGRVGEIDHAHVDRRVVEASRLGRGLANRRLRRGVESFDLDPFGEARAVVFLILLVVVPGLAGLVVVEPEAVPMVKLTTALVERAIRSDGQHTDVEIGARVLGVDDRVLPAAIIVAAVAATRAAVAITIEHPVVARLADDDTVLMVTRAGSSAHEPMGRRVLHKDGLLVHRIEAHRIVGAAGCGFAETTVQSSLADFLVHRQVVVRRVIARIGVVAAGVGAPRGHVVHETDDAWCLVHDAQGRRVSMARVVVHLVAFVHHQQGTAMKRDKSWF